MQQFASQHAEFDYPRAMLCVNAYCSLLRERARGLAEAFHVAELRVYRRLFETIAIAVRRATVA
jgi:hypothetical protein